MYIATVKYASEDNVMWIPGWSPIHHPPTPIPNIGLVLVVSHAKPARRWYGALKISKDISICNVWNEVYKNRGYYILAPSNITNSSLLTIVTCPFFSSFWRVETSVTR